MKLRISKMRVLVMGFLLLSWAGMAQSSSDCEFYWSNVPTVTDTNDHVAFGEVNGVGYTYTSSSAITLTSDVHQHGYFPSSLNIPDTVSIQNIEATTNVLEFDEPVQDPVLVFASIGHPSLEVPILFKNNLEYVFEQDITSKNDTMFVGKEGFTVVRILGQYSRIEFEYTVAENYCNFVFGAAICPICDFSWSTEPVVNGNVASGQIGNVDYTYTSSQPISTTSTVFAHEQFPAEYQVPNHKCIQNQAITSNTLSFSSAVKDPVLVFASIGNGGTPVGLTFQNDFVVEFQEGISDITLNSLVGTEGFVILRFPGYHTSLSFDYNNPEFYANFVFGAAVCDVCAEPTNLTVTPDGQGVLDVAWSVEDPGLLHKVQWKKDGTSTWLGAQIEGSAYSIDGLKDETAYDVRVRTFCTNSASAYTDLVRGTTSAASCTSPMNVRATSVGEESADLNWLGSPTTDAYKVRYKKVGATTWQTISAPDSLVTITGLKAGIEYQYQVRSFCPSGATIYVPGETFTTTAGCARPTGLNTTDVRPQKATFNWDAVAGAEYYKMKIFTPGRGYSYYKSAGTSITIGNLVRDAEYTYEVKALCPSGPSISTLGVVTLGFARFGLAQGEFDELSVYPNPATDVLYINVADYQLGGTLELINANGVSTFTQSIDAMENQIDLSSYETGVYMLKVVSDSGIEVQKVLVD